MIYRVSIISRFPDKNIEREGIEMIDTLVPNLKGFGLFKGLDDSELDKIAKLCSERTMSEGETVFSEGTRAIDLHLCRSGKIDIVMWVREPWNRNVAVHRAEAGELFGWSALVAPYTYTASAECVEAGEELRIAGGTLLELFDRNPHIGYVVMRNLSAEISARLTQIRQRFSFEWLSSGIPSDSSSSTWGEPKKR
jgi:CRP/FNR family cyclic AMP-dependent transcriptional regulator